MTKLTVNENEYTCQSEESVLDALLRQGVNIPFSCKKGTCHSCLLRSVDIKPSTAAQSGLKDTQKEQNYFLACCCQPEQDMMLEMADQTFFSEGKVIVNELLNRNTVMLQIECQDVDEYKAGQFVNLQRADSLTRSYSIANVPQKSKHLELHIRRLPEGQFSEWVHDELKVGDSISVSEPKGHCFYLPDRKEQGMLLVGTGTGLAPLVGILNDALSHGHAGDIHLFHGSSEVEDLYRINEMQQLAEENANFYYTPCVSGGDVPEGISSGRANEVAMKKLPDLKGWRIFLCGHPEMINGMKTQVFLAGASVSDIYTDAFHVTVND